jgi:hypothetical protein
MAEIIMHNGVFGQIEGPLTIASLKEAVNDQNLRRFPLIGSAQMVILSESEQTKKRFPNKKVSAMIGSPAYGNAVILSAEESNPLQKDFDSCCGAEE